jgi:flagellar protein FliS
MSLAAARKYRAVSIESASRGQILVALYDGCLRYCRGAKLQIEAGDIAGKGQLIGNAIAILGELRSTLDHSVAPELCERLDQLYVFFQEQLSLANLKMDASFIDPVTRMMTGLRDAWATAVGEVEGVKAA